MLSANKQNFPIYSVWHAYIVRRGYLDITRDINQNFPVNGHYSESFYFIFIQLEHFYLYLISASRASIRFSSGG